MCDILVLYGDLSYMSVQVVHQVLFISTCEYITLKRF